MSDSAETMREALKEARDTLEALRKQLHGEPFAQNRDRWLNLGMRTVDAIKKADAALSASGTKSGGGEIAGRIVVDRRATSTEPGGVASDPIPSQPDEVEAIAWPDPTPEMLVDPLFDAIWAAIKTWDVNVPSAYRGYCGATGNHARAIMDSILAMQAERRGVKP